MFRPSKRQKNGIEWCVIKTNSHLLIRTDLKIIHQLCLPGMVWRLAILILPAFGPLNLRADEPATAQSNSASSPATIQNAVSAVPGYYVQSYVIESRTELSTNVLVPLLSKYTGTNVSLQEIIHAASDLEAAYVREGYSTMNIVIAPKQIKDGVVTMDVFPGALAQIVVAGNRYPYSENAPETAANPPPPATGVPPKTATAPSATNTNTGPHFVVRKYRVVGNTLLSPGTMATALTNAPAAFGTNVSLDGLRAAAKALQEAYRVRGYVTVAVGLPPQKIANQTVKLEVTEGRLNAIRVSGNHYFSTKDVMQALPSLHTNMILNGQVFQAELNRANANQDRQIYPVLEPGPDPGTSDLTLDVKDRMPLHGKLELNNESSPGTPDLRVNGSGVYNNLWGLEHSLGVQYSFSPQSYKDGDKWYAYDKPLVANYSTFYRIPLGSPESIEDVIDSNPGSFGYDEATRKFNLPPPSGQPELNIFASRSTIDTGLTIGPHRLLFETNSINASGTVVTNTSLSTSKDQEDLTVNNDLGFRLTVPMPALDSFHWSFSFGMDFKTYEVSSVATNNFFIDVTETAYTTPPVTVPVDSEDRSPEPATTKEMEYLPVSLHYDSGWRDPWGSATFGVGVSANPWFVSSFKTSAATNNNFSGVQALHQITGSTGSSGHWVTITPSFYHDFTIATNWVMIFRADGQWASEPLISNEQFGAGGVNSVRGYREGDVFGDTGFHFSLEQDTPPYRVGTVYGSNPLILRGSMFMDYADTFLLSSPGGSGTQLWGTGLGIVAGVGSHWESRFLLSVPLINAPDTRAYEPFFNFSLTAQF